VTTGRPEDPGAPLNHPIAPASNFRSGGDRWYSRSDTTATVEGLEDVLGALEGGHAVAYSSGMAAAAAVLSLVPTGGIVVRTSDVYHGMGTLLSDGAERGLWSVRMAQPSDTDAYTEAGSTADLVWVESPTNPMMEVTDLPTVCGLPDRRALMAVDSTFATPLGQRPLDMGADVVMHSATKFIGGHSDLLLGAVVTTDTELLFRLA
jgi:cystathionine gamma-synthase